MTFTATYSPEDNKLRFYSTGRFDDEIKRRLKDAGFKWAPKQGLWVAPAWSIKREDLLLELCGEIEDEDYSPEERAADRAERFSGYRDNRRSEAGQLADRFGAGPSAFGHQNHARAERQAARHDRLRTGAVSQWSKAEYWQSRTEAVIAHALFKSSPELRRGRVKEIESEIRRIEASYTPNPTHGEIIDGGHRKVLCGLGRGRYWTRVDQLEAIKKSYERYIRHLNLRLSYEKAMLESEGGNASELEIIPGGFWRGAQILKVNKSNATGKVVSIQVRVNGKIRNLNIEREGTESYRVPTERELKEFNEAVEKEKSEKKASAPKAPPLINPTIEDAQKLQEIWNEEGSKYRSGSTPASVLLMTQAEYSAKSKGEYAAFKSVEVSEKFRDRGYLGRRDRVTVFKIRSTSRGSVIVLTDKPQKSIPWDAVTEARSNQPTVESLVERIDDLATQLKSQWLPEDTSLINDAVYVGWAWVKSQSQFGFTEAGKKAYEEHCSKAVSVE